MPRVTDLLDRFRPAAPPGPGSAAGVPADGRATGAELARLRGQPTGPAPRQADAATAVLRYIAGLAHKSRVSVETVCLDGEASAQIIRQARAWPADLIVLGRSDLPKPAQPYLGGHTRRVLEFAEQPVLVVPYLRSTSGAGAGAGASAPAPTRTPTR